MEGGFAAQHRGSTSRSVTQGDRTWRSLGTFGEVRRCRGIRRSMSRPAPRRSRRSTLEHGGGAKLGGMAARRPGADRLRYLRRLLLPSCRRYGVVAVVRFHLALDVGDDLMDLRFASPGTLNTHGLGAPAGR